MLASHLKAVFFLSLSLPDRVLQAPAESKPPPRRVAKRHRKPWPASTHFLRRPPRPRRLRRGHDRRTGGETRRKSSALPGAFPTQSKRGGLWLGRACGSAVLETKELSQKEEPAPADSFACLPAHCGDCRGAPGAFGARGKWDRNGTSRSRPAVGMTPRKPNGRYGVLQKAGSPTWTAPRSKAGFFSILQKPIGRWRYPPLPPPPAAWGGRGKPVSLKSDEKTHPLYG